MRKKFACGLGILMLAGCQSLSYEVSEPTASPEAIKSAQDYFANPEFDGLVTVTDQGVIKYIETVPQGYEWKKVVILDYGYRISCQNLRGFLEDGFTTTVKFQGRGGTSMHYDLYRCLNEDMAHLDE